MPDQVSKQEGGTPSSGATPSKVLPESPTAATLKLVRDLIEAGEVDLFCDRVVVPCVRLPDDPKTWQLRSDRVSAWLALIYERATKDVLNRSQIAAVLQVLQGEAHQHPSEESDEEQLWLRFEEEPLLQAVYDFMQEKERWEENTSRLLEELKKVASNRQIDTFTSKWPKITRLLSARLNRLKSLLEQAGIRVVVEHRREGSYAILSRIPLGDAGDGNDQPR